MVTLTLNFEDWLALFESDQDQFKTDAYSESSYRRVLREQTSKRLGIAIYL
jgi:hypothetical protein